MPEIVFARAHAVAAAGPPEIPPSLPCWHEYCISKIYANFYCLCTQTRCAQLRVACFLARLPIGCSLNQQLRLHDSVSKLWIVYHDDMLLRDSPGLPIPARGNLAAVQVHESLPVTAPLVSYALLLHVVGVSSEQQGLILPRLSSEPGRTRSSRPGF